MIKGEMNRTTNLFVLLILISFILPATAIRYAQAATENSQDSDSTGNEQQQNSSTGSGQESGSSNTGSGQESSNAGNEQQESSSSTENSQQSNNAGNGQESSNTGNEQQQSNNTGNAQERPGVTSPSASTANATSPSGSTPNNSTGNATGVDVNAILAVHNSERAAVGIPPLVWSNKLAADAKGWAEHLAALGETFHGAPGENIISCCTSHGITDLTGTIQNGWASENKDYHGDVLTAQNYYPIGHYTQMVWRNTKEVGCAIAHDTTHAGGRYYLVCRYSPPGNILGQKPY
jgi:uncharacterized protein YkwD